MKATFISLSLKALSTVQFVVSTFASIKAHSEELGELI